MVFCRGCGATLTAGTMECPECGAPAPRVAPPPPARPAGIGGTTLARPPSAAAAPDPSPAVKAALDARPAPPASLVLGRHPYDLAAFLVAALPFLLLAWGIAIMTFSIFIGVTTVLVTPFLVGAVAWPLAWGLWRRKGWARIVTLVAAALYAAGGALDGFSKVEGLVMGSASPDLIARVVRAATQTVLAVAVAALLARRVGDTGGPAAPAAARVPLPRWAPWLVLGIPISVVVFSLASMLNEGRFFAPTLVSVVIVGAIAAPFAWALSRGSLFGVRATIAAALAWGGFCVWATRDMLQQWRDAAAFATPSVSFFYGSQLALMVAQIGLTVALVVVLARGLLARPRGA